MKFIKGLLLSLASLVVGFTAIALPFRLFDGLSGDALHLVFFAESTIYFLMGITFLVAFEKKKRNKEKSKRRQALRNEKIKRYQEEWVNLAA